MINISLKDGRKVTAATGTTLFDLLQDLDKEMTKTTLGAIVDGKVCEMTHALDKDCNVEFVTFDDQEGKDILRHTASHILAQAVKRLYPNTKLAIGPAIENGFYYDFDTEVPFTNDDLSKIEKEMKKIVKERIKLERFVLPKDEAIAFMEEKDEPYKVELIKDLPEGEEISFYKQGEFTDLCAGPHLFDTSKVKAFKLLNVTGAYWRGDESKKMLQRVYGTAFTSKDYLEAHL